MSGLVSLLLVAGLFFLMMRIGCGAHAGHGGHSGRHEARAPEQPGGGVDPVCGMPVAANTGYARAFRGVQYRFCSRECLEKFDASPDQYLTAKHDVMRHPGHHS